MRPKKKIKVALKTNKPQEAKQFNIESLSIAKTHAQIACVSLLTMQGGFEGCLLFPGIESKKRCYVFSLLRETVTDCGNDNLVR